MKPVIGITAGHDDQQHRVYLTLYYIKAIEAAGGTPVVIPCSQAGLERDYCRSLHGVIFSGGADVDPCYFGEEPINGLGEITPVRDAFELALAREALARDMPVLAICRGIQLVNIAAGGSIYQDLGVQYPNSLKHSQQAPKWYPSHSVAIQADSNLARLFSRSEIRVNSFHHQAVRQVAPGFRAVAWASDGVIEAIESESHSFVLGVQWHPECMWEHNPSFLILFEELVRNAGVSQSKPD